MKKGMVLFSVDFELYWGVRKTRRPDVYGKNILGAREVVPRLVRLFETYGIKSTWGCVGALAFETRSELTDFIVAHAGMSAHALHRARGVLEEVKNVPDEFLFFPDGFSLLRESRSVDLVSHGFLHDFPLGAPSPSAASVMEIDLYREMEREFGLSPSRGHIFARNQCSEEILDAYVRNGFFYFRMGAGGRMKERVRSLLALPGVARCPVRRHGKACLVSAGAFLRFGKRDRWYMQRVLLALSLAVKTGGLAHFWWHPHNMGHDPARSLSDMEIILEKVAEMKAKGVVKDVTMKELACG